MKELEVPEVVVGSLSLRDLCIRLRLTTVNNIWKFYGILRRQLAVLIQHNYRLAIGCIYLNEEHGNIITNYIPIALLSVELYSEPSDITNGIGTASAPKNSRKAEKYRCCARGVRENPSVCDI